MKRKFLIIFSAMLALCLLTFGLNAYLEYAGKKDLDENIIFDQKRYRMFVPEEARLGLTKKKSMPTPQD